MTGSTLLSRNARNTAFALTWIAYGSYYAGRKGFSVAKVAISSEFGLGTATLGAIDTAFLAAYALGQLPSGLIADRIGPRRLVGFGLLASAAACALMGWSTGAIALGICFGCNGLAQSTGWPGTTKAMAQWTSPAERGRVMGVWATCYQVGGVAATAGCTWLLARYGWRAVFEVPACWLALIGSMVLLGLRPGPHTGHANAEPGSMPRDSAPPPWKNRLLYSYGAAYFCVKLIRYSLLFWLPFYLHAGAGFDPVDSGYMSTAFEVGGVAGSVGLGWLSDRNAGRRASAAVCSLLALAGMLWVYAGFGHAGATAHVLALAALGALLYGPDSLLSGAAAQDAGGPLRSAAAVGFVNGLGSAGALLQAPLTVGVQRALGWNALFNVFFGLALLACLCLWPALRIPAAAPRDARRNSDSDPSP